MTSASFGTGADSLLIREEPTSRGASLPRLVYVGDVPVARTSAGSMLLYRLLNGYPADKLALVHGDLLAEEAEEARIPNVPVERWRYVPRRYLATRFHNLVSSVLTASMSWHVRALCETLKRRSAEAVLSVAHGWLWLAAARAARRLNLPFHLIVHDDWSTLHPVWSPLLSRQRRLFGREYALASSRLCVSPDMASLYHAEYGCNGDVLYPTRGDESAAPAVRVRDSNAGFTVAYAGSIQHPYGDMLARMAETLRAMGGCLDVYTDVDQAGLRAMRLDGENVRARGFLSPARLAEQIANDADVVFCPMSFEPQHRRAICTAFPSKLAEYTAIGLPILLWAPTDSTAARWVSANEGSALHVAEDSDVALGTALSLLAKDPSRRRAIAAKGVAAGVKTFSLEAGRERFLQSLSKAHTSRQNATASSPSAAL